MPRSDRPYSGRVCDQADGVGARSDWTGLPIIRLTLIRRTESWARRTLNTLRQDRQKSADGIVLRSAPTNACLAGLLHGRMARSAPQRWLVSPPTKEGPTESASPWIQKAWADRVPCRHCWTCAPECPFSMTPSLRNHASVTCLPFIGPAESRDDAPASGARSHHPCSRPQLVRVISEKALLSCI